METAIIIIAVALAASLVLCYRLYSAGRPDADAAAREARMAEEKARAEERLAAAMAKLDDEEKRHRDECERLRLDAERMVKAHDEAAEKRLAELKESHEATLAREREMMGERFKAMASDILRDNSRQLDERSRAGIEAVLSPMKTSLEEFTKGYRECYAIENRDRLSLREEIKSLHELNFRVGREAARLTSALKGNTGVQGRWGEMVLTNILEHSGLQRGRWFVTQKSETDDEGSRLRPDAIIHCPRERDIFIDSKVSITHYLRLLEAEDDKEREALAKAHLQSVEAHIRELREKEYQKNIGAKKGDFVLMFMPHEGAYIAAMNANPDLWQKAYDGHVIMVSPTHLVTVVRLVEQMWQTEDQTVNSIKIAETAGKLLDSLTAFMTDLASTGDAIERTRKSYESTSKRLSTGNNNVVRLAQRLQELGIKSKKAIPERFTEDTEE